MSILFVALVSGMLSRAPVATADQGVKVGLESEVKTSYYSIAEIGYPIRTFDVQTELKFKFPGAELTGKPLSREDMANTDIAVAGTIISTDDESLINEVTVERLLGNDESGTPIYEPFAKNERPITKIDCRVVGMQLVKKIFRTRFDQDLNTVSERSDLDTGLMVRNLDSFEFIRGKANAFACGRKIVDGTVRGIVRSCGIFRIFSPSMVKVVEKVKMRKFINFSPRQCESSMLDEASCKLVNRARGCGFADIVKSDHFMGIQDQLEDLSNQSLLLLESTVPGVASESAAAASAPSTTSPVPTSPAGITGTQAR